MTTFQVGYGNLVNFLLNNYNNVYCIFTDENGDEAEVNTVSGTPTLVVSDKSKDPGDIDVAIVSGALTHVSGGIYGYQLKPTDLDVGYYGLEFRGVLQTVSPYATLAVDGGVQVAAGTYESDLVYRVRLKLKDVNTALYQIDLPVQIWPDEEILYALQEALGQINVTPPMRTSWAFTDVYSYGHGVDSLLVLAAYGTLLQSKAVLEAANTMQRSDGAANLNIQRGQIYTSISTAVISDANRKIEGWKRSLVPSLYGQGTYQYPYQLRRVISFLPGFKNIFT